MGAGCCAVCGISRDGWPDGCVQLDAPARSLIWNSATAELYAASQASIVVLQQVL